MSRTANNRTRCDTCGKLSSDPLGGYVDRAGVQRYIRAARDAQGIAGALPSEDMCDECATKYHATPTETPRNDENHQ
jgi:hypothetical protein